MKETGLFEGWSQKGRNRKTESYFRVDLRHENHEGWCVIHFHSQCHVVPLIWCSIENSTCVMRKEKRKGKKRRGKRKDHMRQRWFSWRECPCWVKIRTLIYPCDIRGHRTPPARESMGAIHFSLLPETGKSLYSLFCFIFFKHSLISHVIPNFSGDKLSLSFLVHFQQWCFQDASAMRYSSAHQGCPSFPGWAVRLFQADFSTGRHVLLCLSACVHQSFLVTACLITARLPL